MNVIMKDWQADPWNATTDTVSVMHVQSTYYSGSFDPVIAPAAANFPDALAGVSTRYFVNLPFSVDVSDLGGAKPMMIRDTTAGKTLSRVTAAPSADEYRVAPAGSERNYIIEINSAQAGNTLHFDYYAYGSIITTNQIVRYDNSEGSARIEMGAELSGDRNCYIDLHTDDTYTDYGMRLSKDAGANGIAYLAVRGTGGLLITTQEAAPVSIKTNNTTRFTIGSSGQIDTYSGTIELGYLATGNRSATIDFHTDDTYTDYGMRLSKDAGANGTAYLAVRGTGGLNIYTQDAAPLIITTTSLERLRITSDGKFSTNAETAPDVDAGGLCLNHGANDGNVLTFKNSDISHPFTSIAEADTYCEMQKISAGNGGLEICCFSEAVEGGKINTYSDTVDSTTSTAATGGFSVQVNTETAGLPGIPVSLGVDDNLVVINNNTNAKHIFKGDGDIYTDTDQTAGLAGTYDDEDDIYLTKAAKEMLGQKQIPDYLTKHKDRLEELSIMKNGFVSHTNMMRLNLGTMDQMFNMIRHLAKKLNISEDELLDYAKQY